MVSRFAIVGIGAAAYFALILLAHDIVVIAEARAQIDRAIDHLKTNETQPSPAVRKAFNLDADDLYWRVAFDVYREEFHRRQRDKAAYFHSRKIVAVPMWTLQLWLWYDRRSMEALMLRMFGYAYGGKAGAEFVAKAAFSKGLNELTFNELSCVRKFLGAGRYNACPEIVRVVQSGRLGTRF